MRKVRGRGNGVSETENRKVAEGSEPASKALHVGQEEEKESPEGKGQGNERSGGPGLCNSLKKVEETGHLSSGKTKNSEYTGTEGSNMWVAKLCGSTGRE